MLHSAVTLKGWKCYGQRISLALTFNNENPTSSSFNGQFLVRGARYSYNVNLIGIFIQ